MTTFSLSNAVVFLHDEGDSYIKDNITIFNDLRLPKDSDEAKICEGILRILEDYQARETPPRPLSIAIFGPPGSGKSFAAEQLAIAAGYNNSLLEINLSQLSKPEELLEFFWKSLERNGKDETKLILIDEFDSAICADPIPLSWLRWFLAPMQDGTFLYNGKSIPIGKTVFFFAGGTAHRYQDFRDRHVKYFVQQKGPDFISRLRGVLDIGSLNQDNLDFMFKRALILQHMLMKRSKDLKKSNGTLNVKKKLIERLLAVGRYKHGARSLEALLDMCALTNKDNFTDDCLPSMQLRSLHLDHGPLDGMKIGVSAGGDADSEFHKNIARELVSRGAHLVYGGYISKNGEEGVLKWIVEEVDGLPKDIIPLPKKWITNLLAYPLYNNTENKSKCKHYKDQIEFSELETLTDIELGKLKLKLTEYFPPFGMTYRVEHNLAWALSMFRMRLHLIQEVNALIVSSGKEYLSSGRFPGIAEEVMLALAFGKPIYILGQFQGAAKAVGEILCLSDIFRSIPNCLLETHQNIHNKNYKKFMKLLKKWENSFHFPNNNELPSNLEDLASFLAKRTVTSDKWPYNGLTQNENRELFKSQHLDRCISLILQGLARLEWGK